MAVHIAASELINGKLRRRKYGVAKGTQIQPWEDSRTDSSQEFGIYSQDMDCNWIQDLKCHNTQMCVLHLLIQKRHQKHFNCAMEIIGQDRTFAHYQLFR